MPNKYKNFKSMEMIPSGWYKVSKPISEKEYKPHNLKFNNVRISMETIKK